MKKIFCLLFLIGLAKIQAQEIITDSIQRNTQIFSLSPMSKKVDQVNGLVLGFGHVENRNVDRQTINGLNIEANPAPAVGALLAFVSIFYLPAIIERNEFKIVKTIDKDYKIHNLDYTPDLKLNGLNISSGCFFTKTSMNGFNISAGNKFNNFNGLSVTVLGTIADHQNGLSVGILNANNEMTGSTIGIYNQSYKIKGLHLGFFNQALINKGVQIGVFNKSSSKGLQLGLWNSNNKRSMPFLNW